MKNKIGDWLGLCVGIFAIVIGILFLSSPPDAYRTSSADVASFGADYYTYQYEATRTVASNAAVTANNIRELGIALSRYSGYSFIIAGMLILIHYGKICFVKLETPVLIAAEVPETSDSDTAQEVDVNI